MVERYIETAEDIDILKNNVIFLSQNDVQFALNYVESTYGKKFKAIYKVSD